MKDTTFGSFPAAIILADILNKVDDKRITHKICSLIADYKAAIDELKKIDDLGIRKRFLFLWKAISVQKIESLNFPDNVKSFTLNVESKFFKEAMKDLDGKKHESSN